MSGKDCDRALLDWLGNNGFGMHAGGLAKNGILTLEQLKQVNDITALLNAMKMHKIFRKKFENTWNSQFGVKSPNIAPSKFIVKPKDDEKEKQQLKQIEIEKQKAEKEKLKQIEMEKHTIKAEQEKLKQIEKRRKKKKKNKANTDFPIQFRINNGSLTKVSYLQECTCKELTRIVKQKLTNDELQQYTFTILDDDGINYNTDDDNLETAFDAIESESEDEFNQDINMNNVSRKLKNPLCLNIILQLKHQTTLNDEKNENTENENMICPDTKIYQPFKHHAQSTSEMRSLHKIIWVLKHQIIPISAESIQSYLPGDKKKRPTVEKINELLSNYEKINYIKSVNSIGNIKKWQLYQDSFPETFWCIKTKKKKTTKTGTKTKKTQIDSLVSQRGVIFYQTQWVDKQQLQKMEQYYNKNNMDSAPKILFNDNDVDNKRTVNAKRQFNGGQSGIMGSYDRNSFGYGIVTTFYQHASPNLTDFKQLMDEQFKPLQQHLLNGNDIIIPTLTSTDMATYGKDKYFKNGKQVIFHSIGTGIAQLDFAYIMYIQEQINNLCKFAIKKHPMKIKFYPLPKTNKIVISTNDDDTKEDKASGSIQIEGSSNISEQQCTHGNLSMKQLEKIKIRNYNVCYVVGLPNDIATKQILNTEQWFGQFGTVKMISITTYSNDLKSSLVTYDNKLSTINAINFCNDYVFDNGRKLKARFSTQRYCPLFISGKRCFNINCPFRHSWCKSEDIFTQKDIKTFKAIKIINDNNDDEKQKIDNGQCDINTIECPHGNLSIKELSNIKIRKRDTCYIVGLPNNIAIDSILREKKWFSQFGNIINIRVNGITCFISYDNDTSVVNAINFCNSFVFDDGSGRKLKATFGTQSYCKWFLTKKSKCTKANCFQKHEWCTQQDVITQQDMNDFKAIPVNTNKMKKRNEHQERGWFVYQKKWLQKSQLEKMDNDYGARNLQKAPKILFTDNNIDNNRDTYTKRKYNDGTVQLIGEYDKSYGYGIVAEFHSKPRPKLYEFKKLIDKQFKPLQQHLLNGCDVIVIQPTHSDIKRIGKSKFYENNKQIIYHKIGVQALPFSHIKYIQHKIDELSNYAEKVDTVEVYTYVPKKKIAKSKKKKPKFSPIKPKPQIEQKHAENVSEEIKSIEEESKQMQYDADVMDQLVSLQIADEAEVKHASAMVIDYKNINVVKDKIEELRNQMDTCISSGFVSELNQLTNVIQSHVKFMKEQDENVNTLIYASKSSELLIAAKNKALETEKELLQQIMNIQYINAFLNNIIKIENLFNSVYTEDEKINQQTAREKFAKNIELYEKKPKPVCDVSSFVELIFGAKMYIGAFKKLLKIVDDQCKKENIRIISNSGAKEKNIERAFYKTFYVYSTIYGNNGFKQMTDVLRCSLVFDSFIHLYKCFGVICEVSKLNNNGGILRCKDRFNPFNMPFGYRDLLINIKCPGSRIICEIQLHHKLFYKHKKISHSMYKKARLFEVNDKNLAYQYANQFTRKVIGNNVYEYDLDELDPYQLLTVWGLSCHANVLIEVEGWDDVHFWKDLNFENLKNIGFKNGQAHKFIKKVSAM